MGTVTFEVRQDGYTNWVRYATVELDTEDYGSIDEMRDAAYEMVSDGEIECGEENYGDSETDETEITDDDYDEDEEYIWADSPTTPVKPPKESSIEW